MYTLLEHAYRGYAKEIQAYMTEEDVWKAWDNMSNQEIAVYVAIILVIIAVAAIVIKE